jgi:hypothetical protein
MVTWCGLVCCVEASVSCVCAMYYPYVVRECCNKFSSILIRMPGKAYIFLPLSIGL